MHLFYEFMFGVSVLLMAVLRGGLTVALRADREREQRMLRWAVLGMGFTAASYLTRVLDSARPGHPSLLGFLCGIAGALALGRAWAERVRLRTEGSLGREHPERVTPGTGSPFSLDVYHVLEGAEQEAARRGLLLVDTEQLLSALLCERRSAAARVLAHLDIPPERIQAALAQRVGSAAGVSPCRCVGTGGALTDQAREVVSLAGQEAHRFDSNYIGTEHLLLGLALVGKGVAAHVLSQQGVTADRVRQEILAARTPPGVAGRRDTSER